MHPKLPCRVFACRISVGDVLAESSSLICFTDLPMRPIDDHDVTSDIFDTTKQLRITT